jgi:hypothetical protein
VDTLGLLIDGYIIYKTHPMAYLHEASLYKTQLLLEVSAKAGNPSIRMGVDCQFPLDSSDGKFSHWMGRA